MTNSRFSLWLFLLSLPFAVLFVDAQPGPSSAPCVDTMAINARFVFVGTIVEILDPRGTGATTNVVVAVEKNLKGEVSHKTQARIDATEKVLADWKSRASRLLIFNGVTEGLQSAIDLSDPDVKVLTPELKVLKNPDQIIQAAQKAIDRHPGVYAIETFMRTVPPETAKMFTRSPWVVTIVPADANLESWAISSLDSKQAEERAEAADALGRFPSEVNVARLKRMLDDPGVATGSGDTQVYFVRERAYESLKRMGVKVPEPILQKEIVRPGPNAQSIQQKLPAATFQNVRIVSSQDAPTPPSPNSKLTFANGDHFYAIEKSRVVFYVPGAAIIQFPTATDAVKMFIAHSLNLEFDTEIRAISSDGRKAILATGICGDEGKLVFLDIVSGQREAIPADWYDATDSDAVAALSGDGRLLSIYSETGPTDSPMTVAVYDWPTKTPVAKRTSQYISAGGAFGGEVTTDRQIEFVNNRVGRKVVDLKTGHLLGMFGYDSARSPDGAWVVEFPDRTWNESLPKDVLIKDGMTAQTRGKLNLDVPLADEETWGVTSTIGTFCGNTGRFVVARGRSVALYSIPSGNMLTSFPVSLWRDPKVDDTDRPTVACSSTGTRVAILSGSRLTFHDLK